MPSSLSSAALREWGVTLYLASGTDEAYVREEVAPIKGLDVYSSGPRTDATQADYKAFSKAMVIGRILRENHLDGQRLLGFGDGYVEIQNIKAVDGTAVGVASDEAGRSGKPDPRKRQRLISVGADLIIPDYRDRRLLLGYLWNEFYGGIRCPGKVTPGVAQRKLAGYIYTQS